MKFCLRVITAQGRNTVEVIIITRRKGTKRPMDTAIVTRTMRNTAIRVATSRDISGRNQITIKGIWQNLSLYNRQMYFAHFYFAKDFADETQEMQDCMVCVYAYMYVFVYVCVCVSDSRCMASKQRNCESSLQREAKIPTFILERTYIYIYI